MIEKVIMANDLISGDVIFLSKDQVNWTKYLDDARIIDCEQELAQIENQLRDSHLLIGVEAIDVEHQDNRIKLKVFREHLRSLGPSVRTDLGKQASMAVAA